MSTSGQTRQQRDEHWCSTGFLIFPFLTRPNPQQGLMLATTRQVSFLKEQGIALSDSKSIQVGNKDYLKFINHAVMYILVHTLTAIIYIHIACFCCCGKESDCFRELLFQLWETLPTISSPKLCYLTFSPALYEDSRCRMSVFFVQSFRRRGKKTSLWPSTSPQRIVM